MQDRQLNQKLLAFVYNQVPEYFVGCQLLKLDTVVAQTFAATVVEGDIVVEIELAELAELADSEGRSGVEDVEMAVFVVAAQIVSTPLVSPTAACSPENSAAG